MRHVESGQRRPTFVIAILGWPGTWFLARLALCGPYLVGGMVKIADWSGSVAEQRHFGLQPASLSAALTVTVELCGPLLVMTGRWVWFGAGMLGVFTALAAIIANPFWGMAAGPDRLMVMNGFLEHLGLCGGFVLVALVAELEQRYG